MTSTHMHTHTLHQVQINLSVVPEMDATADEVHTLHTTHTHTHTTHTHTHTTHTHTHYTHTTHPHTHTHTHTHSRTRDVVSLVCYTRFFEDSERTECS
jgi:hypothetical protein